MVKPGYKQTEIGILPTSWELALLTDKCELLNGLTYTPDNVQDNGLLVLRSSNIQNSQINLGDTVFVNCMVDKEKYVKKDDILICVRNGSAALIGKCAKADRDYYATFGAFMAVLRGQNNDFIFQLLQQGNIQKHINKNSDSTINQITNADFKSIVIPWPSEADERETIATALSDIDALITNLEKLIAKKKAIKQGAMQELLTGKRRLPGFDGRWEERGLDECCYRISVGLATSVTQYYRPDGTVIFRNLNIKPNYLDDNDILFLDNDFATQNPSKIVHTGDVLTVHTGYVGISCVVPPKYDGALTFTTLISTTKPQMLIPEYLSYHLNSELGHTEVENLQAGGGRNNLNVADFKQYKMRIPSDISEQKAIVAFLKDFDSDLDALQKKLDKLTRIKSGMMSELLTGRIRLV